MNVIQTKSLSIGYQEHIIVKALDLTIPKGKIISLVGANGSGKSTILKAIARIISPNSGDIFLNGKDIHKQINKEVAKQLAFLPQGPEAPDGLTVYELVSYGRFPYQKGFGVKSVEDIRMIEWSLKETNMESFAQRPINTLSGGQRQRAWIAMSLAQGTEVVLLDEPTTYLDMSHQLEVLQLLKKLNKDENKTVIMVLHDLNQAARYSDYIIAIKNGEIVKQGEPIEVMTSEMLKEVFNIKADIISDPRFNIPMCVPYELGEVEEDSLAITG